MVVVFLSSGTATIRLITCTLLRLFIASVGTEKKSRNVHNHPKVMSQNKTPPQNNIYVTKLCTVHHSFLLNSHEGSCKCVMLGGTASTYPSLLMIVKDAWRHAILISQPRHLLGPGWKKSIENQLSLRKQNKQVSAFSIWVFMWPLFICMWQFHYSRKRKWDASSKRCDRYCFKYINYQALSQVSLCWCCKVRVIANVSP